MALNDQEAEGDILLEITGAAQSILKSPTEPAEAPRHVQNLTKFGQIRERVLAKYEPIIAQMLAEKSKEKLSPASDLIPRMIGHLLSYSARFVTFAASMPPGGIAEFNATKHQFFEQLQVGLGQEILDAILRTFDDDLLLFIREARDLPVEETTQKLTMERLLSKQAVAAIMNPTAPNGGLGLSEATSDARETVPLSDLRILHVEDEPAISMMANLVLQKELGLKNPLASAPTLRDAINVVEQMLRDNIPLHGILLDEIFPTSSTVGKKPNAEFFVRYLAGLLEKPDFAKKLQSLRSIVFMTGSGEEPQRAALEKLLPPGFVVSLLEKPMSMLALQQALVGSLADAKTVSAQEAASIMSKVEVPIE